MSAFDLEIQLYLQEPDRRLSFPVRRVPPPAGPHSNGVVPHGGMIMFHSWRASGHKNYKTAGPYSALASEMLAMNHWPTSEAVPFAAIVGTRGTGNCRHDDSA